MIRITARAFGLLFGAYFAALFLAGVPGSELNAEAGANSVAPANSETTVAAAEQWRLDKIRALWSRIHHRGPSLSEKELQDGARSGLAPLFGKQTDRTALILKGPPSLVRSPAGALLASWNGTYWPLCSTVLTHPDAVLTALHCIRKAEGRDLMTYFPYEGLRQVIHDESSLLCTGEPGACKDDIALLRLDAPYRITPVAIQGKRESAGHGSTGFAVGIGSSGLVLDDRGLQRSGNVRLDACGCGENKPQRRRTLCFEVDYGPGQETLEQFVNFAGDSGGALFSSPELLELVGIANGIERGCEGSVIEGRYADMREGRGLAPLSGAFCGGSCAERSTVQHRILLEVGLAYVEGTTPAQHAIDVNTGTRELLINLNHETAGFDPEPGTDLSLELPAPLHSDCSRFYGVESCRVLNPPPGGYMIGVKKNKGNPAYQLTAVAILGQDDGTRPQ